MPTSARKPAGGIRSFYLTALSTPAAGRCGHRPLRL